jgi:hypothetical protein
MTGFIASVSSYRNRVSLKEAFEGLEPDEGKLSRPVLRGPGSRKAAWLLGTTGQLAERGLSPRKVHSIVDCSSHLRGSVQAADWESWIAIVP